MKNVLTLASYYPDEDSPISGVFVREHVKAALSTNALNISVLYPSIKIVTGNKNFKARRGHSEWKTEDGIRILRKAILRSGISSMSKAGCLMRYVYSGLQMIKNINAENHIDLIHVQDSYPAGIIAYLSRILYGLPYIVSQHYGPFSKLANMKFKGAMVKSIMRKASRILVVSNPQREEIKAEGIDGEFRLVPNPIDTDFYIPGSCVAEPLDKIHALLVGGISERKGIDILIKAVAMLSSELRSQLIVNLVGGGPRRHEYEDLARSLGLHQMVKFHGLVSDAKKLQFMQQCSFFVLPSRHENFACVLAEVMSCGKPVITTSCGGPADFMSSTNGVVTEVANAEKLADCISKMCCQYMNYDKRMIRNLIVNNYSYNRIGKKLESVYDEVLA